MTAVARTSRPAWAWLPFQSRTITLAPINDAAPAPSADCAATVGRPAHDDGPAAGAAGVAGAGVARAGVVGVAGVVVAGVAGVVVAGGGVVVAGVAGVVA